MLDPTPPTKSTSLLAGNPSILDTNIASLMIARDSEKLRE
jgi:hypothetical protein